jgi:O-antigen ligase
MGVAKSQSERERFLQPENNSEAGVADRFLPWILALVFQCTVTMDIHGSAIRLSLADPLVPLVALFILVSCICRAGLRDVLGRVVPDWRIIVWAFVTSVWLSYALILGRNEIGGWSHWALQNKYLGWYALLFFLLSGFGADRLLSGFGQRFLTAYVVIAWSAAFLTVLAFLVALGIQFPRVFLLGADFRAVGMLVNPNAFGFSLSIAVLLQLSGRLLFPGTRWLHLAGLGLLLAALVLTGSRSAWVACAAGIVVLTLLQRWDWRPLLVSVPIAVLTLAVFTSVLPEQGVRPEGAEPKRVYVGRDVVMQRDHVGVSHRVEQFQGAMELWKPDPLRGAGLGVYLQREIDLGRNLPQQIHSSYLWLLAETGLVGAILFVGFFMLLLVGSWSRRHADPVAMIGIPILVVFGIFALFQEALYQRHIWFVAGILAARVSGGLLGRRARTREPDQDAARSGSIRGQ